MLFRSDGASGFYKGGETSFTIQKALKLKTPFWGAEIDDTTLFNELLNLGYTAQDVLFFYFVRQIPQAIRSGTLRNNNTEQLFAEYCAKLSATLEIPTLEENSYSAFLSWYEQKNQQPFSVKNINSETCAPLAEGTLFTQKLSAQIGVLRDAFAAEKIGELLEK